MGSGFGGNNPLSEVTSVGTTGIDLQRTLTHRIVTLHIYSGSLKHGARDPTTAGVKWVSAAGLADVPISNAGHAVLAAVSS